MTQDANKHGEDTEALMAHHGITRSVVEQFHYRTWRYSKLSDAVAQAQRESKA